MCKSIWKHITYFNSFSQIHSYSYSVIALQELNLNFFYPKVYWNCACLSVEASGITEENDKSANSTNYGKVAKAIYKMKYYGLEVLPPSINKSSIDFTPIEETNSILFGIGGIAGINTEIAEQIISNRPYSSFEDFYNKNSFDGSLVTFTIFRQLIKAGCFDELNKNRINLMKQFIQLNTNIKENFTMANLPAIIKTGIEVPKSLLSPYNFLKYITDKQFYYGPHPKLKSKKLYWLDERATKYFKKKCLEHLKEGEDYFYENEKIIIVNKSVEKLLKKPLTALKEYINTDEFKKAFNDKFLEQSYEDACPIQDVNHWSFEATSYYHNGEHELDKLDKERYLIYDFTELPEEPIFVERNYGKRTWKQYDLSQIAGTVLARNDNNHLITLLTTDNQVVNVKFYSGLFAHYKRQISEPLPDGKKKIIDPSFFSRGNLIIICGFRNGESDFIAKRYSKSIYQHTCQRIKKVNEDGSAEIQTERLLPDED